MGAADAGGNFSLAWATRFKGMQMNVAIGEVGEERLTHPLCGGNVYQGARLGLRYIPLDKLGFQNIQRATLRYAS